MALNSIKFLILFSNNWQICIIDFGTALIEQRCHKQHESPEPKASRHPGLRSPLTPPFPESRAMQFWLVNCDQVLAHTKTLDFIALMLKVVSSGRVLSASDKEKDCVN